MPMTALFAHDSDTFESHLAPWIATDPDRYALSVGISRMPHAWRALVFRNMALEVALVQTRPRLVILESPFPPATDSTAMVADLLQQHAYLSGIRCTSDWASALTTALHRRPAAREVDRLHRLVGPPRLPHAATGSLRTPDDTALDLLCRWRDAFNRETIPHETFTPTTPDQLRAQLHDFRIWIDGGQPVALAARTRPLLGGWSIASVYTPTERRRRGYAGALVHGLSAELLAKGAQYVALYTDSANPTSNALYARIGFVPQLDQVRQFWEAA